MKSPERIYSRRLLRFTLLFLLALIFYPPPDASAASLEEQIRTEQEKAAQRRSSLSRLSRAERDLNSNLARAEDRILALEESLARQEESLISLAASDADLRLRHSALLEEKARTEEVLAETLRTLWEIHSRREGVGGRDLPDWHVTDREHNWSARLLSSMEEHRAVLLAQSEELAKIMAEREAVAREVHERLRQLNAEKETLLESRISFARQLQEVRREKQDTEAELSSILALAESLNLRLQEDAARGNIENARGKLPRPLEGNPRIRFNDKANPPVRGATYAAAEDDPVRAVHWGRVVHNDILRGFGRVVILMHGEAYYSLYAFLAGSELELGEEVAASAIIGTAGFVPDLDGPGLYFELRFHQKAINPEEWFRK